MQNKSERCGEYRRTPSSARCSGMSSDGIERAGTIEMTDDGLVMPDELVGFAGILVVEWPSESLQQQRISVVNDGVPKVCEWICRGVMPSGMDANGVPGGHLRFNGDLYEIADQRSTDTEQGDSYD